MSSDFSEEQKRYFEGLARGLATARGGETAAALPAGPERIHYAAQDRVLAGGGKLTKEDEAKRAKNALDIWDEIAANAAAGVFPKGTDVFLYKFHGLFYVAPAQDAFMCRLRIPNGILDAHKLRAVADLAEEHGGGYAHVTTRANLQLREIAPGRTVQVLQGLAEAGIITRGAGADNVRNITGGPTAGIDPREFYDTRPLGLRLHHTILNHRELYGLPRKFNIAFDGGGAVAALADTNDIGFSAVRIDGAVRFRVAVGGITGHGDFATDLGVAIEPEQCVPVAIAIVRVFIDEGDRTDRKRARLKYVLERMGRDAFLAAVEARLPAPLERVPVERCELPPPARRDAHIGFHPQRQEGLLYCGAVLPTGRLSAEQMRGLAALAEQHGSGTIRLTVWQNLILSDIPESARPAVETGLTAIGLAAQASPVRAGMVACTGNTGCKFSLSDTKRHAQSIVEHLETRVALDTPLNIHLTGCPNSCAQHAIADIGLLGTRVVTGEDSEVEGYHLYAGGGFGANARLGRELARDIPADRLPNVLERLIAMYLARRASPTESFYGFAARCETAELRAAALAVDEEVACKS